MGWNELEGRDAIFKQFHFKDFNRVWHQGGTEFPETGADRGHTPERVPSLKVLLAKTVRCSANPVYLESVLLGDWRGQRWVLGSPYLELLETVLREDSSSGKQMHI